mmetsp:Transcript_7483/g.33801  ORF Transcript_7483/g.33801 Transcript_7483/m.33801 type:complete len:241 (-) Transcript_7483:4514-5236(-)
MPKMPKRSSGTTTPTRRRCPGTSPAPSNHPPLFPSDTVNPTRTTRRAARTTCRVIRKRRRRMPNDSRKPPRRRRRTHRAPTWRRLWSSPCVRRSRAGGSSSRFSSPGGTATPPPPRRVAKLRRKLRRGRRSGPPPPPSSAAASARARLPRQRRTPRGYLHCARRTPRVGCSTRRRPRRATTTWSSGLATRFWRRWASSRTRRRTRHPGGSAAPRRSARRPCSRGTRVRGISSTPWASAAS